MTKDILALKEKPAIPESLSGILAGRKLKSVKEYRTERKEKRLRKYESLK